MLDFIIISFISLRRKNILWTFLLMLLQILWTRSLLIVLFVISIWKILFSLHNIAKREVNSTQFFNCNENNRQIKSIIKALYFDPFIFVKKSLNQSLEVSKLMKYTNPLYIFRYAKASLMKEFTFYTYVLWKIGENIYCYSPKFYISIKMAFFQI